MSQTQIGQIGKPYKRALFIRFLGGCFEVVEELRARRNIRKSLGRLSSSELRDIGLIASDIDSANSAPLSQEAAAEIQKKTCLRSANW